MNNSIQEINIVNEEVSVLCFEKYLSGLKTEYEVNGKVYVLCGQWICYHWVKWSQKETGLRLWMAVQNHRIINKWDYIVSTPYLIIELYSHSVKACLDPPVLTFEWWLFKQEAEYSESI